MSATRNSRLGAAPLLSGLALALFLGSGPPALAQPPANPPLPAGLVTIASAPKVRRDVSTLSAAQLTALRNAFRTLRDRPSTNPRGWQYQANMHTRGLDSPAPDTQATAAWNQCPHGRPYFLAWHRVYLFFFERLLRETAGGAAVTLPYWDYIDQTKRALPAPFRPNPQEPPVPGGQAFFVADRAFAFNSPTTPSQLPDLRPGAVSALAAATLYGTSPVQGFQARVEGTPHGPVHVWIGGQGADTGHLMGYVPSAARDPIFWLHHANIDRLWSCWRTFGRPKGAFPTDATTAAWLTTARPFFDAGGVVWNLNGSQVLALADLLNGSITYDDVSDCATNLTGGGPVVVAAAAAQPEVREVAGSDAMVLSPAGNLAVLGLSEGGRRAVGDTAAGRQDGAPARVVLTLRGITLRSDPRVSFAIKIKIPPPGLDPGTAALPEIEVAQLTFFGKVPEPAAAGHDHGGANGNAAEPFDFQIDITDAVRELSGGTEVAPERIAVSLEPDRGIEDEAPAAAGRFFDTRSQVTISRIVIETVR